MDPKDEVHTVVEALRRYMSDNPQACDTPDGIARWWLHARHTAAVVERALESLLQQGLLERMPAADGRVRYRRADTAAPTPAPSASPAPPAAALAPAAGPRPNRGTA